MTSPVRAAVIGLGFGERVHVPGLALAGAEVVAVCARDAERSRRVAAACGARAASDWREVVADPAVELVSVATPPALQAEIARAAIASGKAVLAEKPLGLDAREAAALADLAEAAGVPTLVDFGFRALPAFLRARQLLGQRALGAVLHAEVSWHVPTRLRTRGLPPSWKDDAAAGGGVLLSLGVHALDYVEWLLGPVRALAGEALTTLPLRADSDDLVLARLELADGTPVALSISSVSAPGEGHRLRVFGEEGTLTLANREVGDAMRGFALELRAADDALVEALPPVGGSADGRLAPFAALAGRLVAALREGGPCEPSFRAGARALALAEAIRGREGIKRRWTSV